MADNFTPIQLQDTFLSGSGISATVTSIVLKSLKQIDGSDVTMSDLGTIYYATLEPNTSREENISFTGITQNADGTATLTGVTRGLKFVTPYDQDTALRQAHSGGSLIVFGDTVQLFNKYVGKDNDETITQTHTFTNPNFPRINDDTTDPTADEQFATKGYVDRTSGGAAVSKNREVIAGNAGATVSGGNLIYLDIADSEWKLVDATDTSTLYGVKLGIAQGAGTDGNPISGGILTSGLDENQSGLTANNKAYATDTPGAIGTSAGTNEKVVGYVTDTTDVIFDANTDDLPTASEKDALVSTSGNPNSTNKYVSENDTSNGSTITASTIAFVDSNPDTITDSGNGFLAAGFRAGQTIVVSGSASNDGSYTLTGVAAGTLTLASGDSLTTEGAGASVTIVTENKDKVVRANGSDKIDEIFLQMTDADATTLTDMSNADALHTHSLGQQFLTGVGTSATKTYFNFDVPFLISDNVPSGDFWTTTNLTITEQNFSQFFYFVPTASAACSLISVNAGLNGDDHIFIQDFGGRWQDTKDVICEFALKFDSTGTNEMGFGLMATVAPTGDFNDSTVDAACFTVDTSGNLYAHTANAGVGSTETQITGITLTTLNTYRIEWGPTNNAKFYVNGTLEATVTTTLPDGTGGIRFGFGSSGNTDVPTYCTKPYFAIEK